MVFGSNDKISSVGPKPDKDFTKYNFSKLDVTSPKFSLKIKSESMELKLKFKCFSVRSLICWGAFLDLDWSKFISQLTRIRVSKLVNTESLESKLYSPVKPIGLQLRSRDRSCLSWDNFAIYIHSLWTICVHLKWSSSMCICGDLIRLFTMSLKFNLYSSTVIEVIIEF